MAVADVTNRVEMFLVKIFIRVVLWAALFLCLAAGGGYAFLMHYANSQDVIEGEPEVIVEIPRGTSVKEIGAILSEARLLKDDIRFMLLARWKGVSAKLKAGEFALPQGKTPSELLDILVSAKPYQYSITIPEGLRGAEIAQIFADEQWCDEQRFVELITDEDFIAGLELGVENLSSLEGFLYPDTYYLTKSMRGDERIIKLLVDRFSEVWAEVVEDLEEQPDMFETVILASVVEKETGAASERPVIAAVFHNRLRIGMRLQSDPTVVYGSGGFGRPITKTDLKTPTPYNTYTVDGLPVGPIANPGKEALHAVLHPEDVDYLYFVSKNDGTHQFSKNLRDHINAVNKYQRKKGQKKSKDQ